MKLKRFRLKHLKVYFQKEKSTWKKEGFAVLSFGNEGKKKDKPLVIGVLNHRGIVFRYD